MVPEPGICPAGLFLVGTRRIWAAILFGRRPLWAQTAGVIGTSLGSPPPEGSTGTAPLQRHSRWFWLAIGLVVVLAIPGCFIAGGAVYRKLARQRADRYAQAAADLLAAGQIDAAIAQAQAALKVQISNPNGQLQLARAYSAYSNPKALVHWLNYFALAPDAGALPSLEFARYNILLGQPDVARRQLRQASLKQPESAAVLMALASLETNTATVEALLADARRFAKSPGERFAAAVTGYASLSAKEQVAGRRTILELAGAGDSAAQAFLLKQPGTNALFALRNFELTPTNRWRPEWQPVADLVAGRARDSGPLVTRLQAEPDNLDLATALANQGVDVATPALMPLSRSHVGLFFIQADQLCAQHRWGELDQLVNDPHRKLPGDLQAGLAALASFGLGDTNTGNARVIAALAATQGSAPRLFGLAQLAADKGCAEFEAEAWMRLDQESELRETGGRRLYELGQRFQRLKWIAAGAKKLSRDNPATDWFGVWVYSRCLLQLSAAGVPEPTGHQPEALLAAALRNTLLNRTDQALAQIESHPKWSEIHPRFRLVAALAYQRAGLHSELRRTLAGFTEEGLLPEEAALLRQIEKGG
jgi:hypothetical protein